MKSAVIASITPITRLKSRSLAAFSLQNRSFPVLWREVMSGNEWNVWEKREDASFMKPSFFIAHTVQVHGLGADRVLKLPWTV